MGLNCLRLSDLRTAFGGIKASGREREVGWESFRFFTESKNFCIRLG